MHARDALFLGLPNVTRNSEFFSIKCPRIPRIIPMLPHGWICLDLIAERKAHKAWKSRGHLQLENIDECNITSDASRLARSRSFNAPKLPLPAILQPVTISKLPADVTSLRSDNSQLRLSQLNIVTGQGRGGPLLKDHAERDASRYRGNKKESKFITRYDNTIRQ